MGCVFLFAALTAVSAVRGTELVPERYLRPRDFNHHPFTDVGETAAAKQPLGLDDVHPYAILASKRPREGRQFPDQDEVLYPNPPAAVLPRVKPTALQAHLQPAHYEADPYNIIPKNYAFSYSVKDKHSGDDFSHSQAHNGKATRGQYRVKLPDGRVQVVSYTADHKGYRADVQYEGAAAAYQQVTPVYEHTTPAPTYVHQTPQQYIHQSYSPTPATYYQHQPSYTPSHQYIQHQPTFTATPSPYQQEQLYSPTPAPYHQEHSYSATPAPYQPEHSYSATPAPYQQEHYTASPSPYQQSYSPTPATYADYGQQSYVHPTAGYRQLISYASQSPSHRQNFVTPSPDPQIYASPSPVPDERNFASPSPITFPTSAPQQTSRQQSPELQAYASPSPTPFDGAQYASPSGPEYEGYASGHSNIFAVQPHLRSTPAPFGRHQFVTSTESSALGHILVTPRTQRNSNKNDANRRVFGARQHVIYRFKSS